MKYTIRHEDEYEYEYETIVRPDGKDLATLTEPEDRTWGRDLSAVWGELNRFWVALETIADNEDFCTYPDDCDPDAHDWNCVLAIASRALDRQAQLDAEAAS